VSILPLMEHTWLEWSHDRHSTGMGDGTFFKVGGHKCTLKKIIVNLVVWIGNCDVTSIEIWRHYIYTI